MNSRELIYAKNLPNTGALEEAEEEITTLRSLGFKLKYSDPYGIEYHRMVRGGDKTFLVDIYLGNRERYPYPKCSHIAVMVNGTDFCKTNTLKQALELLTK